MNWYCWHVGTVADGKLAVVARRAGVAKAFAIALWGYLMERAAEGVPRGTIGEVDFEAAAVVIECEPDQVRAMHAAMADKGMIKDGALVNWEKRQHGTSTPRVRKFREKQKQLAAAGDPPAPALVAAPAVASPSPARETGNGETVSGVSGNAGNVPQRSETACNLQDRTGQTVNTSPSPVGVEPAAARETPTGEGAAGDGAFQVGHPKGPKPRPPSKRQAKAALAADWQPGEHDMAYAGELLRPAQVNRARERFVEFHTTGRGSAIVDTPAGWSERWFVWCAEDARQPVKSTVTGPSPRGDRQDVEGSDRRVGERRAEVLRGLGAGAAGNAAEQHQSAPGGDAAGGRAGARHGDGTGERRADGRRGGQPAGLAGDVRDRGQEDSGGAADRELSERAGDRAGAAGDPGLRTDQGPAHLAASAAVPGGGQGDDHAGAGPAVADRDGPAPGADGVSRRADDAGPARADDRGAVESRLGEREDGDLLEVPEFLSGATERQAAAERLRNQEAEGRA